MSIPPSSPFTARGHPRRRTDQPDIPPRSSSTWGLRNSTFASSPARSSSPPTTPYFLAHTYADAHIRSSPELGPDVAFCGVGERSGDMSMFWTHRHLTYAPAKFATTTHTPYQTRYSTYRDLPPSSDFDVLELSEEADPDLPDLDSEPTSDSTPGQSSGVYSDSEEEEDGPDDEGDRYEYRFGYDSNRTTFFRTSAERGQWKSNPMPCRPTATLLQTRKSAPTPSRVATPTLPLETPPRTISEPAPSTTAENFDFAAQKSNTPDRATEAASLNSVSIHIIPPTTEEAQSPCTLPSLTSDRETSPDIDQRVTSSSPLPSSSPPMSHASFSMSRLSRSISPISYDRESSLTRSSSPLSELPDDEGPFDEDQGAHTIPNNNNKSSTTDGSLKITSTMLLDTSPQRFEPTSADAVTISDPSHVEPPVFTTSTPPLPTEGSTSTPIPSSSSREDVIMTLSEVISAPLSPRASPSPAEEIIDVVNSPPKVKSNKGKAKRGSIEGANSATLRDKNGAIRSSPEVANTHMGLTEKKRKKDMSAEGAVTKKRKTAPTGDVGTTSSNGKRKVEEDEDENKHTDEAVSEPASVSAPVRKQKKKKFESKEIIADPESAPSTFSTKRPAKSRRSKARASSLYTDQGDDDNMDLDASLDSETTALHSQACGLLIETMALSRASSLPVSALYKLVMQSQPALKAQRTEREWLRLFDRVLHAGEAGRGSGVFGKVESSGKDKADRPLEAQWFYVPELDEDQERASLIKAMMPRPAKRSETKKYKQYYWRPVDKLSMWDPEDSL